MQGAVAEQAKKFTQQMAAAIAKLCAGKLTPEQMERCLREAALASGWGRFVVGNNYWMLPGRGDAGAFLLVRVARDTSTVSGVRPIVLSYAKFSSIPAAIEAWRKQRGSR